MRSFIYLTTTFLITTSSLIAMNDPRPDPEVIIKVKNKPGRPLQPEDIEEFTFKCVAGQSVLITPDDAVKEMEKQRLLIHNKSKNIFSNFTSPNLQDCKDILEAHSRHESARKKVKVNVSFTPKYMRQLHRSLALSHFFLGKDCMKMKTLTLEAAFEHFEQAITNAKTFIHYEDDSEDCVQSLDVMKCVLAESIMNASHNFSKKPRQNYEDTLNAGKLYEEVSQSEFAYFAYSNAYEFLIADPDKTTREVAFLKEKLRYLYPSLDKEQRQISSTIRSVQAHDKGPTSAPFREFRTNLRNWRTHYEDQAETFSQAARSTNSENVVIYFLSAARDYIRASRFVTHSTKKDELMAKASTCVREFEMNAAILLNHVEDSSVKEPFSLREIYTSFYKSKYFTAPNASPLDDLYNFTYAAIYAGNFEHAKERCDLLCLLETENGSLSEKTKYLRMNVDALNGNFDELIAHLAGVEKAKEEKKLKNRRKKERLKAKKIAEIQAKQAERVESTQSVLPPEANKKRSEPKTQVKESPCELNVETTPERPEKIPAVVEKKKTKGIPNPAFTTPQEEEKKEQAKVQKKILTPTTYELCKTLLSGNKGNKIFSRDKVIALFTELNCEFNETRGKGSHAVMRYVVDKETNKIIGAFPDFEQARPEENETEESSKPMNITMPIPKEWDGPIPFYLAKNLRKMLEKMGYTLETIECKKVDQPKTVMKKGQKPGKKN